MATKPSNKSTNRVVSAPEPASARAKPTAVPPFAEPEAPLAAEALAPFVPIETKPVEVSLPTTDQAETPAPQIESQPTIAAEAAAEGTKQMLDTPNQIEDNINNTTGEVAEKATAMFNDMNTRAKTAMEKAGTVSKDVVEFHKGNLEAVVEAGKIAAQGAQTVAQNAAEYGRRNFEATTAMFKSVAAIKSPTELLKLQGEFMRSQFDGAVAEMSKSTELGLKLAGEMFQPIQSRYTAVAEEMKTRVAA